MSVMRATACDVHWVPLPLDVQWAARSVDAGESFLVVVLDLLVVVLDLVDGSPQSVAVQSVSLKQLCQINSSWQKFRVLYLLHRQCPLFVLAAATPTSENRQSQYCNHNGDDGGRHISFKFATAGHNELCLADLIISQKK